MKCIYRGFVLGLTFLLCSCGSDRKSDEIHFSTSGEYPPFEYMVHGELQGFDIDLATLLSEKLGKKAVFENMQFSSVLPALTSGQVDAAISTITITPERQYNVDFTVPYYFESMGLIFKQNNPIHDELQLASKRVACQLGSTMEFWLKKHIPGRQIMVMDNNNQAIEALKAGYVDAVLLDGSQSRVFSQKNSGLAAITFAKSEDGYGIALKKNSPLQHQLNQALLELKSSGAIEKLRNKWLGGT
jgi:polar amino acid transport system substrate-binding protein